MRATTEWLSPKVPHYIDLDALAYLVFSRWDQYSPRKTGNMASYNDYKTQGDRLYIYNTCEYGGYQDYLIGKDGHKGAYYGWLHEEVPTMYDRILEELKDESRHYNDKNRPEWLKEIYKRALQ